VGLAQESKILVDSAWKIHSLLGIVASTWRMRVREGVKDGISGFTEGLMGIGD
jgi:hypothetical protein